MCQFLAFHDTTQCSDGAVRSGWREDRTGGKSGGVLKGSLGQCVSLSVQRY